VNEISPEVVEATWRETASFSDARGRREMERAGREQPDLLAFVLGATEELSASVHALGIYVFLVIWQVFRRSSSRRIPQIKAGVIERRLQENEEELAKHEGSDPRLVERAALVQISRQPEVFKYMIEAIMEAPEDPDDPVPMTPDESGTLFLVLKTVIDVLNDVRECAEAG
jgi:hypothetical protein